MLDTLLEIGRVLRTAPQNAGLRHHRYVKTAPLPDDKNPVVFWRVEVAPDGTFDFGQRERVESETFPKSLFYLNFKTSDADSMKKYVFGDIYRSILKRNKDGSIASEDGNFRLGDPKSGATGFRVNSFLRGEADAKNFGSAWLDFFRDCFRAQLPELERILASEDNIYIHFDHAGTHWHGLPEMALYNAQMLEIFGKQTPLGIVLQAALYKTIASGQSPTPGFGADGDKGHRNRAFKTQDDLLDLVYAIDVSTRSSIRKGDMKIVVLPRGEGLTADQIERFFRLKSADVEANKSLDDIVRDEEVIAKSVSAPNLDVDDIFAPIETEAAQGIAQFDFIFSKVSSSASAPDADMIEISGLERSKLSLIAKRIGIIRRGIEDERKKAFPNLKKELTPFSITFSFLALLGDTTTAKKKFQAHLFGVLPQIYTETYFRDPVLLPALIQKTEFHLREGESKFPLLRFDFLFLTRIQIEGEQQLMDIENSKSYKVGYLLGKFSKQFSGKDSPVKSFEKNYAGLFSRRVSCIDDVAEFQRKVTEMLIMHRGERRGNYQVFFPYETQQQLTAAVKGFSGPFHKTQCAFGFFEAYFEPFTPKEKVEAEEPEAELAVTQ